MTVNITDNWVWPENVPPTKVYLHKTCPEKKVAETGLREILERERIYLQHYDWLIALLWEKKEGNCVDLFGYSGLEKGVWPGNPNVRSWQYCNGIMQQTGNFTCTDGIILLGAEERLRRNRRDLSAYIEATLHPHDLHTRFA